MESTSYKNEILGIQVENPDITLQVYTPADKTTYLFGIKHLKEAVLLKEVAELRLKNILRGYMFKG